ncbi:MAG: hypothetical protein EOO77_34070, partial [Oxalobacteraceae bacterium]
MPIMMHDTTPNQEMAAASCSRILESLQHPVLVFGPDGEVIYANATAAASLGGWIVGLALPDIFSDYLRSAHGDGAPAATRLTSRHGEEYEALFNPIGGGSTSLSL